MNKKGIELSINVIVSIILGMMMFFAGIALFTNILGQTYDTQETVDAKMEQEVLKAFDRNDPVYVHRSTVPLNKQDTATFWVGIYNIYPDTKVFKLEVTGYDSEEIDVQFIDTTHTLPAKEKIAIPIVVNAKAIETGQHGITVTVKYNETGNTPNADYDKPKILYIRAG